MDIVVKLEFVCMHVYDGRSYVCVRREDENGCEAFALTWKSFAWRQIIDWTVFVHLQVARGRVMSYGMHQVQLSIAQS